MEYAKTQSLEHVKAMLGHKCVLNTDLYVQLQPHVKNDEYVSAVAKTINDAAKLVENGFEYVLTSDDIMLFRKRK